MAGPGRVLAACEARGVDHGGVRPAPAFGHLAAVPTRLPSRIRTVSSHSDHAPPPNKAPRAESRTARHIVCQMLKYRKRWRCRERASPCGCAIRVPHAHSHWCCSHGNGLGSHQITNFQKITDFSPLPAPRPDAARLHRARQWRAVRDALHVTGCYF